MAGITQVLGTKQRRKPREANRLVWSGDSDGHLDSKGRGHDLLPHSITGLPTQYPLLSGLGCTSALPAGR